MTIYALIKNVTAVQSSSAVNRHGGQNMGIKPAGGASDAAPASQQTYFLTVNGIGACSATVQLRASNDGVSWANNGLPMTATGSNVDITPAVMTQSLNQGFAYFGAYVTAISGTAASVTLTMSA